jgi:hypothetical protein
VIVAVQFTDTTLPQSELSIGFRSCHERKSADALSSVSRRAAWRSTTSTPIAV